MKDAMTQSDSLRKAAILVSLLDARSADAILDPMDEQLSAQVRQAVMELDEVSAAEQESVLADFFGRGNDGDQADGGVELEIGDQQGDTHCDLFSRQTLRPKASSAPSLSFLADVAPALLADLLAREHPQTIAVVVAHLPAEHAGQVLERLPPALATEALSRMAWLTTPLPEVLADLESELRRRLAPHGPAPAVGPASLDSVRAILESLPGPTRAELINRLARQDERLVRRLEAPLRGKSSQPVEAGEIVSRRFRLQTKRHLPAPQRQAAVSVPYLEFEDLSLLADGDLARLGAAASGQTLALALIEADELLTRRILQVLPRSDAAELRRRLQQPGPLRLKEIDQAQRQLAELAQQLAHRGHIALPASRRFAAAA
jgi:flagellar motor switch protein FliG